MDSSDFATDEPYLYPMRMKGGVRENILNDASSQSPGALILLQDNINLDSLANVLSVLAIHMGLKRGGLVTMDEISLVSS
jgi:hypothetical protein